MQSVPNLVSRYWMDIRRAALVCVCLTSCLTPNSDNSVCLITRQLLDGVNRPRNPLRKLLNVQTSQTRPSNVSLSNEINDSIDNFLI